MKNLSASINPAWIHAYNRRIARIMGTSLLVVIIIVLSMSLVQVNRSKSALADQLISVRIRFANRLQHNMQMLTLTAEQMKAGDHAAITAEWLPKYTMYLYAVSELNDAIINAYGDTYIVIPTDAITSVTTALGALRSVYAAGGTSNSALHTLLVATDTITALASSRFEKSGDIIPREPVSVNLDPAFSIQHVGAR